MIAVVAAGCCTQGRRQRQRRAREHLVDRALDRRRADPARGPPDLTFAPDGTLSGYQWMQPVLRGRTGRRAPLSDRSDLVHRCWVRRGRGLQEAAFLAALQRRDDLAHGPRMAPRCSAGRRATSSPGPALPRVRPATPRACDHDGHLAGTSWVLIEMGGTADLAHLVPTLEFGVDGQLSGFAGCNQFSGPYAISGADLTLGSLATTKMACIRPGSVVESTYLEALVEREDLVGRRFRRAPSRWRRAPHVRAGLIERPRCDSPTSANRTLPPGAPWRLAAALDDPPTRWLDLDIARRRAVAARPTLAHDQSLFRQPVTTLDDHLGRGLRVAALADLVEGFAARCRGGRGRRRARPISSSDRRSWRHRRCATGTATRVTSGRCGSGAAEKFPRPGIGWRSSTSRTSRRSAGRATRSGRRDRPRSSTTSWRSPR